MRTHELFRSATGSKEGLVSTLSTVLLAEVSLTLSLCQLAFFPITTPVVRFHTFLFFVPFVAAASFVSLPVYVGWAAIVGLILSLRVQFMPLDFYEFMFSNPIGAVMSLTLFALLMWLVMRGAGWLCQRFEVHGPVGMLVIAAALFVVSFAISTIWLIYIKTIFSMYGYGDVVNMFLGTLWSPTYWSQVLFDWVVWLAAVLLANHAAMGVREEQGEPTLRVLFQRGLFLVVVGAFLLTTSISYLFSSVQAVSEAQTSLEEQATFLAKLARKADERGGDLSLLVESYEGGYGDTIVVLRGRKVVATNDPDYVDAVISSDAEMRELGFVEGEWGEANEEYQFLQDEHTGGINYFRSARSGEYGVAAFAPSERVFANRTATITLNTLCYLVLFSAVYVLVSILLNNVVVKGFRRTNDILALITDGDLNQRVNEHRTKEFCQLSDGINTTVDALKDLIDEAERRMEHDLATARAIQESALPRTFPPFPEVGAFDIYASMDPAKEVGGDFFDFFLVDDHTLGFLIADVSGKGIPGALFMMAAKAEIENYMLTGVELAQAVADANEALYANNDAGMFVTVWAALLDWETGELTYVNAGHNYPLLKHGSDDSWEWLKKRCGTFLGLFDMVTYRQETLWLKPGDKLILYTDGVNEAFSANNEQYGNDRLEAFLAAHNDLGPRSLVEGLRGDVAAWAVGTEQSDDVTILVLEVKELGGTSTEDMAR